MMNASINRRWVLATCFLTLFGVPLGSAFESPTTARFEAHDTLHPTTDSKPDAQDCLDGLAWRPEPFSVTWEPDPESANRRIVSFPSPVPSGDATNDRVTMVWYPPFEQHADGAKRPAVLVVHESGRAMPVGRLFARAFQAEGMHAFLIHLPYYGLRRGDADRPEPANLVTVIRQAIADVRRARDAIAVLPEVDASRIAVQGTSLGGFVTSVAASLDRAYQTTFVMLAGGNLYDVLIGEARDAANFRRDLERAGYEGDAIRQLLWQIEPTRVAHRLDPQRTWLYTAKDDEVVPMDSALALARTARLSDDHHVRMAGGHYTAIIHFASIVRQVAEHIRDTRPLQVDRPK
ncbi:MAG: hypothetical protein EA424_28580 [Planctomycetaceae bacterium]|nr:MAG: hypothetical protein EA424_28580 [Planctomycetaceae bacterium]